MPLSEERGVRREMRAIGHYSIHCRLAAAIEPCAVRPGGRKQEGWLGRNGLPRGHLCVQLLPIVRCSLRDAPIRLRCTRPRLVVQSFGQLRGDRVHVKGACWVATGDKLLTARSNTPRPCHRGGVLGGRQERVTRESEHIGGRFGRAQRCCSTLGV